MPLLNAPSLNTDPHTAGNHSGEKKKNDADDVSVTLRPFKFTHIVQQTTREGKSRKWQSRNDFMNAAES